MTEDLKAQVLASLRSGVTLTDVVDWYRLDAGDVVQLAQRNGVRVRIVNVDSASPGRASNVYGAILRFIQQNGRPPILEEVAHAAGISAKSAALKHVDRLRSAGLIAPAVEGRKGVIIPVALVSAMQAEASRLLQEVQS